MSRMAEADLAEFLTRPHIGVLSTLRRDGMPYTVPVWWLWDADDGGGFWLTGTTTRVWCRQLRADPRASLCIEASDPWTGHVGVDGHVTVHEPPEFDIWPVSTRLVEKYVGRGDAANRPAVDAFVANMKTEPRMLFRLAVEDRPNAVRAIDLRVYRGKRADREHQARVRAADEGGGPDG
jgi:PPOX class probable F420-dependent enzyme